MKQTKLQKKDVEGELSSHLYIDSSFVVKDDTGKQVISFNKKDIHLNEQDFNDMVEEARAILYNTQQKELAELQKDFDRGL